MIYCKQLNKGLYILQQSMCITHENCRNCLFNLILQEVSRLFRW